MTLIISHMNAHIVLELIRNITFYNKWALFLHSVVKVSLFHQGFSKIILMPIKMKCMMFYASEKIACVEM